MSDSNDVEYLLQFLYVVPVGMVLSKPDGEIVHMNPTATSILASLAGGRFSGNVFEAVESIAGDMSTLTANHAKGTVVENVDFKLPGAAKERVFSLSVHKLADDALAFIFSDVTERVRQRYEILRRERQLRSIFESVHNHMIVLLGQDLLIQEYNDSVGRLTGLGDEVVGEGIDVLFGEPLDLEDIRLRAEEAGWTELEGRMVKRDGPAWWGDSILTRIPDQDGVTSGFALVTREASARRERELDLLESAYRDQLTAIPNRRRFDEFLAEEFERAKMHKRPLSLCVMDIDHFKRINDNYGHAVGDEVLKLAASRLESVIRGADLIARTGGEEFAVVVIDADSSVAASVAERCRDILGGSPLELSSGETLTVTISVGVAELQSDCLTPVALYTSADEALYAAKGNGRNRVEVAAVPVPKEG